MLANCVKTRVTEFLKKKFNIYANLNWRIDQKETENFKRKVEVFQKSICEQFDISSCKCTDILACVCPKEKKLPMKKSGFLFDQQSGRKMYIEPIDKQATTQMEKSLQRKLTLT